MDQQSLPTTLDTSPQLYQAAPALYGANVGSQTQSANDNMAAIQAAYSAQQQQEAQMRPIDLAYRQQEVNHMGASGDYLNAEAAGARQRTDQATQEQAGNVAGSISKNQANIASDQVSILESHGARAGQAAAILKNLPDSTPAWYTDNVLQQTLGDMYHPSLMNWSANKKPAEVGAALDQVSQDSYAQSTAARAATQKQNAEQGIENTRAGAQIQSAGINASERERANALTQATKVQAIMEKNSTDSKNRGAALAAQAQNEPDPDKKADLLRQADTANQIAQAMAEAQAQVRNEAGLDLSDITQTKPLPRPTVPSVQPPVAPSIAPASAPGGGANPGSGELGKDGQPANPLSALKAAFNEDPDPTKYDYRPGPTPGTWQRRPKQKAP